MRKLKGTFFDGGALVLFIFTLIAGIGFANEGGHKVIEQKGFKESAKGVIEQRVDNISTQALYTQNTNQ